MPGGGHTAPCRTGETDGFLDKLGMTRTGVGSGVVGVIRTSGKQWGVLALRRPPSPERGDELGDERGDPIPGGANLTQCAGDHPKSV